MKPLIILFTLICVAIFGKQIDTFYGPLEVEEPVLLELIDSPAFQRLSHVHQYGVSYYTTHREEYTRYAHSLGVFAVLRIKSASLEEQIAGLLHDVSHTVFSHVGDWLFNKEYLEEDYQNSTHLKYLEQSGLSAILIKHGFNPCSFLPKEESFPALEQKCPNLCADRIDYNIQGAFYQDFITREEGLEILNDLNFINGCWVASTNKKELLKKLVRYSLFMSQDCWGSPTNHLQSRWLADAMLKSLEIGCLTLEEIHFGTDQEVWDKLLACPDPIVMQKMHMVSHSDQLFDLGAHEEADLIVKAKFRGIDPWVCNEGELTRLTTLEPDIAEEYFSVRQRMYNGWAIKMRRLE